MFRKLIAAVSAIALSLGMVALTAAPAAATDLTCRTFDRDHDLTWNWNDTVVLTWQGVTLTKPAGSHDNIAVSGATPAKITIFSNGGTQDRTGQTVLNGDWGSNIMWVEICVTGSGGGDDGGTQTPPDPTPYVLVAWKMPNWSGPQTPSWPQTFVTSIDLATKDLNALDHLLTQCGTYYQVDLYNDSKTTADLIAGGYLNGSNDPAEDFPQPMGWGQTFKLIKNADCETTPAEVTFDAECTDGTATPTYTIPSSEGVVYKVRLNGTGGFVTKPADTYTVPWGTTVEVKAFAETGHTLIGTTSWSSTFDEPDCRVKPLRPTFTQAQCTDQPGEYGQASYFIPETTGVKYEVKIGFFGQWEERATGTYFVDAPTIIKVRAVPVGDYELKGQTTWERTFVKPDCEEDVTPLRPTITDAVCTGEDTVDPATYTIPGVPGITYQLLTTSGWVDIEPDAYTVAHGSYVIVRAVPLAGFELTEHDKKSAFKTYVLKFDNLKANKDCIVPAAPTFDPEECIVPGEPTQATYTVPSDFGVKYQLYDAGTDSWKDIAAGAYDVDDLPSQVKIRAVAKPGFHFLPGAETEWTFDFDPSFCPPTLPAVTAVVTFVDATCFVPASYSLGVQGGPASSVAWAVSGGLPNTAGTHQVTPPVTVEITAAAADGYGLTNEPPAEWSHEFEPPADCQLETHPLTGGTVSSGGLGIATALLAGGALLLVTRLRRRAESVVLED